MEILEFLSLVLQLLAWGSVILLFMLPLIYSIDKGLDYLDYQLTYKPNRFWWWVATKLPPFVSKLFTTLIILVIWIAIFFFMLYNMKYVM